MGEEKREGEAFYNSMKNKRSKKIKRNYRGDKNRVMKLVYAKQTKSCCH